VHWNVTVDADDVGPLGAQSGTVQRLFEAGFSGETGTTTTVITVDADGSVTAIAADLSTWWATAIAEAEPAAPAMIDGIEVQLSLGIGVLTGPVAVEAPCAAPTTEQSNGVEVLLCGP